MPARTQTAPFIRWMIHHDMPTVLDIEQRCFEFPWTEEEFKRQLRQRNCIGMVVELNAKVVGYMVYELNPKHIRLLNLAVHPKWRLRGAGRAMIGKLASKLSPNRKRKITLEVRESNLPAQKFFRAQGLKAVKVLRRYFHDSNEDAYRMELALAEEPLVSPEP